MKLQQHIAREEAEIMAGTRERLSARLAYRSRRSVERATRRPRVIRLPRSAEITIVIDGVEFFSEAWPGSSLFHSRSL